jgi:hypothetical protein
MPQNGIPAIFFSAGVKYVTLASEPRAVASTHDRWEGTMGLYEWRFRISLAGSQRVAAAPVRQEPSFRALWQSAARRLPARNRTRQTFGRFYSVVRTYCF